MSDEEKKAIDYLTKYINWETFGERMLEADIETILNLVKNQENQIEYDKTHILTPQTINLNYIPKSKIEEKIKELEENINKINNNNDGFYTDESIYFDSQKTILQELLEREE